MDIVSEWLEAKVENLIYTLKKSYNENDDYVVKIDVKPKEKGHGGSKKKTYFITSECFKLLALSSNAKNGEKLRKYYIKLESIVDQYKNEIIELYNHEQKIKKLNKKIYPRKPGIYIIREINLVEKKRTIRYKLGSTGNLMERMAVYNTGSSNNIDLIFFEECINYKLLESCIKYGLKKYVYRGKKEFYDCSIKKIKTMIKSCINFHDNKVSRPSTPDILQIQFTFVKEGFNWKKIIRIELDEYKSNDDHLFNEYNDHWTADDINIFKKIEPQMIFDVDVNNIKGGNINKKDLYERNKKAYKMLMKKFCQKENENNSNDTILHNDIEKGIVEFSK